MKSKFFSLIILINVFIVLMMICPTYALASEAEVLRRLEKMEKEIKALKKENMLLRQAQEQMMGTQVPESVAVAKPRKNKLLGSVMSKYDMQIYGRVKVDLNYDTVEFRKYNDWLGAVGVGDAGNDSTNFNPRDSRIGFKISTQNDVWMSKALIETDFYGDNNGNNFLPRMRLGYLKLLNKEWNTSFLVGQDWIPVAQLNPPAIDFGILAASGNLWWRVPQVTVRKSIGDIELLGSVMKHRRTSTAENDRMPWVLGRIAYKGDALGDGSMFAIGGGYRREKLSSNAYGLDNDVDRWLAVLELKLKYGRFTFAAEPWIGDGLEKEWLRYDMGVNTYDETGAFPNHRPELIRAVGGFASLSYELNAGHNISIGYGIDDPRNSDMRGMNLNTVSGANDRRFTKNEMYFINMWYGLTDAVKIGGEIMHLDTERFSDSNVGTRFTLSAIYGF